MNGLPDVMLELLQRVHEEQQAVNAQVKALTEKLEAHIKEEEDMFERHTAEIVALQGAFPKGDMPGHQMYHASIIKRNEFLADMFQESAKHIAKYGLLAFLVWLLWHGAEDLVRNVLKGLGKP